MPLVFGKPLRDNSNPILSDSFRIIIVIKLISRLFGKLNVVEVKLFLTCLPLSKRNTHILFFHQCFFFSAIVTRKFHFGNTRNIRVNYCIDDKTAGQMYSREKASFNTGISIFLIKVSMLPSQWIKIRLQNWLGSIARLFNQCCYLWLWASEALRYWRSTSFFEHCGSCYKITNGELY